MVSSPSSRAEARQPCLARVNPGGEAHPGSHGLEEKGGGEEEGGQEESLYLRSRGVLAACARCSSKEQSWKRPRP